MIRRLIILLLIVGCGTEPEEGCLFDCEGTCNGDAREDNCDVCDADTTNDCVQDCSDVWGGTAYLDENENCVLSVFNFIKSEEYENLDCTGSLSDTPFYFNYSATYTILTENRFIWTLTSPGENPYIEEGTYSTQSTDTGTTLILSTNSIIHMSEDESSMYLIQQLDTDSDPFGIFDTCLKLTYEKQ